jgi:hypothetical protein
MPPNHAGIAQPHRQSVGGVNQPPTGAQGETMLETIAIILIIFWLLGLVSSYTMGGFIHVLLVVAVVVILIRVIQGRRL